MSALRRGASWAAASAALIAVPLASLPVGAWPAVLEGAVPFPWRPLAATLVAGSALALRHGRGALEAEPRSTAAELLAAGLLCALVELPQPWPIEASLGRVVAAGIATAAVVRWAVGLPSAVGVGVGAILGTGWIAFGTQQHLLAPEATFARLRWGLGAATPSGWQLEAAAILLVLAGWRSPARAALACVAGILALGPLPLLASAVRGSHGRLLGLILVALCVALGAGGSSALLRPAPAALALGLLVRALRRPARQVRRYPPDPPHAG
ncbi:MAG: hypothetical protein AAFZ65_05890 [Planctomycetota bacterium]